MQNRTKLSKDWLAQRADLHDVRITDIQVQDRAVLIVINDQWSCIASSDGENHTPAPGSLVLQDANVVHGALEKIKNRTIGELVLKKGDWHLTLVKQHFFGSRDHIVIRATAAFFEGRN